MAAKQVGKKVFDFATIAATLPKSARSEVSQLRATYAAVKQGLEATPQELAPVDWDHYRKVIKTPGVIDAIKAKYDSLKFEYPADTLSGEIEAARKESATRSETMAREADARIASLKAQLEAIHAEKPLDEVTVDEFLADKPEWSRKFNKDINEFKY